MAKKLFSWFSSKKAEKKEILDDESLQNKEQLELNNDDKVDEVSSNNQQEQKIEEDMQEETEAKKVEQVSEIEEVIEKPKSKNGVFSKLFNGLKRTRESLGLGFLRIIKGKKINDELFEELEELLITSDFGTELTSKLIQQLEKELSMSQLQNTDELVKKLSEYLENILKKVDTPFVVEKSVNLPKVILMVGVNGVGKTTTIGKLANKYKQQGLSVMLAAGDTFRAAAVEQLKYWGEKNGVPVISQSEGADSASVIFDALNSATAKKVDVLIADTAGRLHNKSNLMDELQKIVRVLKKIDPAAPHEVFLTVDATTGQNAIAQAKVFNEVVNLTGINVTKLDGTAKGGIVFNLSEKFGIPIRYIGIGEGVDDLREFNSSDFVNAIFSKNE
ncbi:MAG: signal recognition particle-docking protein FtsY [Ruminobacter sp.]|nr:signal recognition particle-docking protein FtsY [Ruminobacter sp.]